MGLEKNYLTSKDHTRQRRRTGAVLGGVELQSEERRRGAVARRRRRAAASGGRWRGPVLIWWKPLAPGDKVTRCLRCPTGGN